MRISLWLAMVVLVTFRLQGARTNFVEHLFAAGAEGWHGVDLPDGASLADPVTVFPAVWTNPPVFSTPHLAVTDASSGTIFFAAPSNTVAQLGRVYGSFLEFELASSHQTWNQHDFVVIRGVTDGRMWVLVGGLQKLPSTDWTSYVLRLVAGSFRVGSKTGPPLTHREFRNYLGNARELWLPAEFGSGLVETTRLRNVRVSFEPQLQVQCVPALTLDGFSGQKYRIEFSNLLGDPTWQSLTNVTMDGQSFQFIDTTALEGMKRFYRAIEIP